MCEGDDTVIKWGIHIITVIYEQMEYKIVNEISDKL